ncbi:fumarylacetoacetate hydrolase family protein [Desulfopila aestuarii]|uniref:2-keto-4-pentenoate hydratase/2-oxohepta-3-ene-1,7-dioic acid hydratase (Catechol pathway) n=1 Tax=Desulfopila aestuarii DSM 18488 TaxID=1121416 RepID=A0A1M7Y7G6_9BACT|nr:fumarylacetoacetate hydrolase family protein [Desulfopila aestuarii]SHO48573.1 2-keto-4-pentenoate hydratase/2-oxohepta-3-ene-1,7-dioic acid hydratase (catechol pathway) [Desulfopila aestuarii DSM 18488]
MNTVRVENRDVTPSKIVCIGRNYVEHIHELGNEVPTEMVVFSKPNSAITTKLKAVHQEPLHYEAEICYLVENDRLAAVGCGLDLTKRELQSRLKAKGLPWERAKAFDGAALFSPFVQLASADTELGVELLINDEVRQSGSTDLMMYKPSRIFSELQTFMTFEDGDIIMTGTPAGVGVVQAGENFEVRLLKGEEILTTGCWQAV